MKHYIAIIFASLLLPSIAMGQYGSHTERPKWVDGFHYDSPNSRIEVVFATDYIEEEAWKKAEQKAKEQQSIATGQRVIINNTSVVVNDEYTVKQHTLDRYWEYLAGEYRVYMLVQTAKNPELTLESATVTYDYKFSPRVFIPGMAQIHKGQTTRGALFITGEVAAIGGIVAFEGLRSSYDSKIKQTHNSNERQDYINKADNMSNIRNGFIAGAIAIYAWNVIDGIVAKGKKHVVVGGANVAFAPYAEPMSKGMLLSVTF